MSFRIGGMKETIDAVRASAEACVSFVLQELAGLPLGDPSSSSAETNLKVSANISSYVNSNDLDNPADDGGVAALKWAVCMVVSRSHSLGSKTGRWLTPILDLANHLPEVNGTLKTQTLETFYFILPLQRRCRWYDLLSLLYEGN